MAKRNKKSYDIDPELEGSLSLWADRLKTTKSSLLNLFLAKGILGLENEESDAYTRLKETKSIRFKYLLFIEDIKDKIRELTGRY